MIFRVLPWVVVVLVSACTFNPALPPELVISCADNEQCPVGYSCQQRLQRCVRSDAPDREAPSIESASVERALLKRNDTLRFSMTVSEALAKPAAARLVESGRQVPLVLVSGADGDTAFSYELVIGADDTEGSATIVVDFIDLSGNEAAGLPAKTVELDFTPPTISSLNFLSPRTGDGGVLEVRSDEAISVRLVMNERVQPNASLLVTPEMCAGPSPQFQPVAVSGTLLDFAARAPTGQPDCIYRIELAQVADLAGNVATGLALDARYRVDAEAPIVTGFETGVVRDGGFSPATVFGLVDSARVLGVRFRVDASATDVVARLDEALLPGCLLSACSPVTSGFDCRCEQVVSTAFREGSHVVSLVARDVSGNVRALSTPVQFDFSPPRVLASTVQLQLTPPPTCPLGAVGTLGVGATARLVFSVDEPLGRTPVVQTTPTAMGWVQASMAPTSFVFTGSLTGATSAGTQRTTVDLIDAVGNAATVDLSALGAAVVVDTQSPNPPDTLRDGGVVYLRKPWGDTASTTPSFAVQGSLGSAAGGAMLRVLDGPNAQTAAELGRGRAASDGSFVVTLARADRAQVYVTSLDEACNESAPVDVKEVEWVATLGQKRVGSTIENPHGLEERTRFERTLTQDTAREPSSYAATQLTDGAALRTTARRTYQQRVAGQSFAGGGFGGGHLVFDAEARQLVTVRPTSAAFPPTIWRFNGNGWTSSLVTPGPPDRDDTYLAYDAKRARLVLFGGRTGAGPVTDTWEFDGKAWVDRTTPGAPTPNNGFLTNNAFLFDPVRGVTVALLGGLWQWDGRVWSALPSAGGPSSNSTTAAFDGTRNAVHYFDGSSGLSWTHNGQAWTRVAPMTGPTLTRPSMAFDAARGVMVLQGNGTNQRETYELVGTAWVLRAAETIGGQDLAYLAFEPSRGEVVKVGSFVGLFSTTTMAWTGTAWVDRTAVPNFPNLSLGFGATFDTRRGVTVFTGSTTQEWNGQSWRAGSAVPNGPQSRGAFDARSGLSVFFGGGTSFTPALDVFSGWNGVTWSSLATSPRPTGRAEPALVYDTDLQRVLLYGGATGPNSGVVNGETWSWRLDGGWAQLNPTSSPPPLSRHQMAYDARRRLTVLFGSTNTDTWLFDGGTWARAPVVGTPPAPRQGGCMAYDSTLGTVLMHGGTLSTVGRLSDELWEWDGTSWAEISPPGAKPGARENHMMAYDSVRRRMVITGQDATLWELGLDERTRPAQVLRFVFGAAQAEPTAQLRSASLVMSAGGQSGDGGVANGAMVWVWQDNAFVGDVTNQNAAASPGPLQLTTVGDSAVRRLLVGSQQSLVLAVTPLFNNADLPAAVALDSAQLTVRYRRP